MSSRPPDLSEGHRDSAQGRRAAAGAFADPVAEAEEIVEAAGISSSGGFGRNALWRALPLALVIAASVVGLAMGWHRGLMAAVIENREAALDYVGAHLALSIVVFSIVNIVVVVFSVPAGSAFTALAGFLFGTMLGGGLSLVSATVGCAIVFFLARSAAGGGLEERAGSRTRRIAENFRNGAFSYLLFLRIVPVLPFWLVNIAPALVRVPPRIYVWATLVGLAPGTYAFAFIGAGLDSAIAAQEAADPGCAAGGACAIDISALVTGELVAALVVLGVVSLIPLVWQRLRRRAAAATSPDIAEN